VSGAPRGKFIITRYRSAFAGKHEAWEVVTETLAADGSWRPVGYALNES
jgi:hypothetical protein